MSKDKDLVLEIQDVVRGIYKSGYNCAESIILGFKEVLDLDISPDAAKMFSGYGGGLGHAGCMCGALSGSIGVLGYFKGRKSNQDDRTLIYALSRKFHDRFEEEFGATCCRVLNPNPFGSKEQRMTCMDISVNAAKILMRFLQEEELVPA